MLMHPEAQQAAQKELDGAIGRDRLPEMEDRDALPYIAALVKECLRYDLYCYLRAAAYIP